MTTRTCRCDSITAGQISPKLGTAVAAPPRYFLRHRWSASWQRHGTTSARQLFVRREEHGGCTEEQKTSGVSGYDGVTVCPTIRQTDWHRGKLQCVTWRTSINDLRSYKLKKFKYHKRHFILWIPQNWRVKGNFDIRCTHTACAGLTETGTEGQGRLPDTVQLWTISFRQTNEISRPERRWLLRLSWWRRMEVNRPDCSLYREQAGGRR
jgi:hypothetical protein